MHQERELLLLLRNEIKERERDQNFSNPRNFPVEAFIISTNLCHFYYIFIFTFLFSFSVILYFSFYAHINRNQNRFRFISHYI